MDSDKPPSLFSFLKSCLFVAASGLHTITLISHASKVMLKILQASLQQHVNQELPDVQGGFRIGRGTRDQIANHWIVSGSSAGKFQKNIYFCFDDYTKAFDCVDHINCGKFFKKWEYQTTLPGS